MQLALAVIVAAAGLLTLTPGAEPCRMANAWSQCSVGNSGEQVDIGAGINDPGGQRGGGESGGSDSGGVESGSGESGPGDSVPGEPAPGPEDCGLCRGNYTVETLTFPAVTAADLASFRPATPTLTGDSPIGYGLVGGETNVIATASEHDLTGTLLGHDVTVRFTPTGYLFDYGDGTTRHTTTGGTLVAKKRGQQFTETDTSHHYRKRGNHTITVTVHYTASVDFGTGWRPVTGHVTATSTGYPIRVLKSHIILVDKDCNQDPHGPYCPTTPRNRPPR
jgi:hypothetical protein